VTRDDGEINDASALVVAPTLGDATGPMGEPTLNNVRCSSGSTNPRLSPLSHDLDFFRVRIEERRDFARDRMALRDHMTEVSIAVPVRGKCELAVRGIKLSVY
jgi:hypothetical protein